MKERQQSHQKKKRRKPFQQLWLTASLLQQKAAVRTVTHTAPNTEGPSLKRRARPPHNTLLAADAHEEFTEGPLAISVSVTQFTDWQPKESLTAHSCVGTSVPADHINTGIISKLCTTNCSKWKHWHMKVPEEHMLGFLNWLQFLKQKIHICPNSLSWFDLQLPYFSEQHQHFPPYKTFCSILMLTVSVASKELLWVLELGH